MTKKLKLNTSMKIYKTFRTNMKKYMCTCIYLYLYIYLLFIIGNWNANVGWQEIPGVTGKFSLGVQNESGQS